jgi:hypothetical protein
MVAKYTVRVVAFHSAELAVAISPYEIYLRKMVALHFLSPRSICDLKITTKDYLESGGK